MIDLTHDVLFPPLEPSRVGKLRVDAVHELYFEESGNPVGKPVVLLHGGPGGGTDAAMRRFWDPRRYRIVLFDQRGCGKSTPFASLQDNTTWHLVADIEALREHLGIDRWQVFGGSWGSTLALAYAQMHPQRVTEMVLRGIFLLRQQEIHWFYQQGANRLFPDEWQRFIEPIAPRERNNLLHAYHRRLTSDDSTIRQQAAASWSRWEASTLRLQTDEASLQRMTQPRFAEAFARIECHYFVHRGFLRSDNALLDDVPRLRHIPAVLIHGRYDVICPVENAWDLHRAWPEAELRIVPAAGHSAFEPGIAAELVAATQRFADFT